MMLYETVRWLVTVNQDLGVSMIFTFVYVLWCGERQHANRQDQDASERARQPHNEIVCEMDQTRQLE